MSESTNSSELISLIGRGLTFSKYELENYDERVLIAFLRNGQSIFGLIPKEMVTERIRDIAAECDKSGNVMEYIAPGDSPAYRALSIAAVASNFGNLKHVEASMVDFSFIESVTKETPSAIVAFFQNYPALIASSFDRVKLEAFLSERTGAAVKLIIDYLGGRIETDLINDDFIQRMVAERPLIGTELFKSSKQALMVNSIKQGAWPPSIAEHKPESLADAIKKVMLPNSSNLQAWHKAYIKTHDTQAVIALMDTPARSAMLESIYTRDELMPFMKTNNKVKGRWLCDDLGL